MYLFVYNMSLPTMHIETEMMTTACGPCVVSCTYKTLLHAFLAALQRLGNQNRSDNDRCSKLRASCAGDP